MSAPTIARRSKLGADGKVSLFLQFTHHGQKIRESLNIYVKPEDWDQERRKIRGRSDEVKVLNNRLTKAVNRANEIIWIYELQELPLTPEQFKEEFWNKASREDFLPWMREEIQRQYNRRLMSNYTKWDHLHVADKIAEYCEVLPFSAINRAWLEKFDAWHARRLERAGYDGARAREKALKCIRKYLLAAEGAGKDFTNPFEGFKWPKWKSSPVWLEVKELKALLALWRDRLMLEAKMARWAREQGMRDFDIERYVEPDNVQVMHNRIRNFLFQCFSGARYSDLVRLRWEEHVNDGVLVFDPVKTQGSSGKTATVPITPVMEELMLNGSTTPPKRGRILDVPSNQKYNNGLKVVGELLRLDKELTSHVGRHTFGATMIAGGVSVVSLMEMMGVTKINTVMVYIHSSLEQQAREIKRAQEEYLPGRNTTKTTD